MADDNAALAVGGLPSLAEVCESPDDFLGELDVAALNLMCAAGLPGAEGMDIAKHLEWLDEAACQVDLQIREHFQELALTPSTYSHSPGYYCCNFLLRTLQELFGVRYNPARIGDSDFQNPLCITPDFKDSRDLFIHGMIDGPGGTCASMPVMYVAVGRRVGCPLKLVEAPGHLFFRWEDPTGQRFNVPERFNVEGSGEGISFYPDDFYRTWPREWAPHDTAGGWYLKSLSPVEEFASFLATRGSCLEDNGRIEEVIQAFSWATKLLPGDLRYGSQLVKLLKRSYEDGLQALESQRGMLNAERVMFEQRQRRLETVSGEANRPRHVDSCQCLQCRQARPPTHQMPGHPPECGCVNCMRGKSSSFSSW